MRASGGSRWRVAGRAGLSLVSLFLALLAVEGLVRAFRLAPQTGLLYTPDPRLGARLLPGARIFWRSREFEVPVSVNSLGFRDLEHAVVKPRESCRVAFLGDSFVEALQVPIEETFYRRLERDWNGSGRRPPIETLAFGLSGWGATQEYLAWQLYATRFRPDLTVLIFNPANDVRNDHPALEGDAARPYLVVGGTGFELRPPRFPNGLERLPKELARAMGRTLFFPQSLAWARLKGEQLHWLLRKKRGQVGDPGDAWVFADPAPPAWEEAWRATEEAVRRLDREVRDAGGGLLVAAIADGSSYDPEAANRNLSADHPGLSVSWDSNRPWRRMADFCAREGIDFLDMRPFFRREYLRTGRRFTFDVDSHWNGEGHRIVAELFQRRLEEHPPVCAE